VRSSPHLTKGTLCCGLILAVVTLVISTGCGSANSFNGSPNQPASVEPVSSSAPTGSSSGPSVLLYTGTGTSSTDVAAVEAVLASLKLNYRTANTSQMEGMSESSLAAYRLLIVPGGNSITIGENLSRTATTNIHNAVVNNGLHYLGICAGAFFGGYSIYNGLDLTNGVWFNFYADYNKGINKEAVELSFPHSSSMDMYWQNGRRRIGQGMGDPIRRPCRGSSQLEIGNALYDASQRRPDLCRHLDHGCSQWDVVATLLRPSDNRLHFALAELPFARPG
jgi:Biotin-protein ligase, N terminal